jgi:hypothetical protein
MAKLTKKNTKNTPDELLDAINNADVWLLVTATADKNNGGGATIAVRESYATGAINMIAMLLEQKEIFDAVQAKITQVKMMDKKKGNNSPDLTVN